MSRVVRIFQMSNLKTEQDARKVCEILKELSGIMRVEPEISAGVIEVEYENAIVDRHVMREELLKEGYDLLI